MKIISEIISFIQNAFIPFSNFQNIEQHIKIKLKDNLSLIIFAISAILVASLCISVSLVLICLNLSLQIEQFKNIGLNAELIGSIILFIFSSLVLGLVMLIGQRSLKIKSEPKTNQTELIQLIEIILSEMAKSKHDQISPSSTQQSLNH